MGVDLRSVDDLDKALTDAHIDKSLPTLFLSECVMIYLKEEQSAALIKWAASTFGCAVFLTYEQILPDDPFGRVMLRNLEDRGIPLLGIRARPDLPTQRQAYLDLGWDSAEALDMNDICNKILDRNELSRLNRIEMFDEMEEWRLLQAHYCIVWATRDTHKTGIWNQFGLS
jgi:tRNA wybutosine-synthesizing protein 4